MPTRPILSAALIALLVACGGGGGSSDAPTGPILASPDSPVSTVSCPDSPTALQPYVCQVLTLGNDTEFSLTGAPEGMRIQPRSGELHWTPSHDQQGLRAFTIERRAATTQDSSTVRLQVAAGSDTAPAGIYVSPEGDDGNSGSLTDPLLSLHEAAGRALPGDQIFLRGGVYFNEGFGEAFAGRRNNLARITNSGTAGNAIVIRPHGNEYVKLKSDVNGIVFNGAEYWTLQGIELEGSVGDLSRDISLSLWWATDGSENRIQGRGVAMNSSYHIIVRDCVIHDFSGAGLSNNGGANITVERNVIYDNAWWSTSGTHGFANSKPATRDNGDSSSFKIVMRGNLVFGNQSSMISHVFGKGQVKLEIDEGNGLHMQDTERDLIGRFLAEDNLSLLNGKAGLGLNTVDGSVIRNNSFYLNARVVAGSGELSLQSSVSDDISANLLHPAADRRTIRDFSGSYAGVGSNFTVPGVDAAVLPASVQQVDAVFADPEKGNFFPAPGIPADQGVSAGTRQAMAARLIEYGLRPAPAPTQVTPAYVNGLKQAILDAWPRPVAGDGIPDDLALEDPETGFCYRYETRGDYPGEPMPNIGCP